MKRSLLALIVLLVATMLLSSCADHREVDALKVQLASTQAQLANVQAKQAQEQAQQQESRRQLEVALHEANSSRVECRVNAERRFNEGLENNGTPVEGKKDVYRLGKDTIRDLDAQQHAANADCQKQYDSAVREAELLYGERR